MDRKLARFVLPLAGVLLLAAAPGSARPVRTGGTGGPVACNDGGVTWTPTSVWPPNHKMQTIDIYYDENDEDGDTLTVSVESIGHNQILEDGSEMVGSGKPNNGADFTPGGPGTAVDPDAAHTTAQIRAERSGTSKAGRTYTITVRCTDAGHPESEDQEAEEPQTETIQISVHVPHDQGRRPNN